MSQNHNIFTTKQGKKTDKPDSATAPKNHGFKALYMI